MKIVRSSDVVIEFVLDLIIKGEIKPGDKLPSTENLARKIGTSVISAREAVQNLASVGLVEISHGRGIFMTEGAPVFEELLEARKIIESHNAMRAARNIDPDGLKNIEALLAEMQGDINKGDIDSFSEMDYQFHLAIGKAAGNRILLKVLENIEGLLRYQQSTINSLPGILQSSSVRHREILDAIQRGDSDLAARFMTQHITEVIESWKKHVGRLQERKGKERSGRVKNPIQGRLR
ncbi:MAG TPA: FadR/GntR family transcriptional regulator [Thermodesulfobacteriota bacterium]|nr:FadR/GntR family transcriptional regulator [Thermodesulfobacteriota bacterium]